MLEQLQAKLKLLSRFVAKGGSGREKRMGGSAGQGLVTILFATPLGLLGESFLHVLLDANSTSLNPTTSASFACLFCASSACPAIPGFHEGRADGVGEKTMSEAHIPLPSRRNTTGNVATAAANTTTPTGDASSNGMPPPASSSSPSRGASSRASPHAPFHAPGIGTDFWGEFLRLWRGMCHTQRQL